jgi:phosphoribosylformylglycinamidine cyclo-ligase
MNVNDVVCVGADPIAVLDYLAVEEPDPEVAAQIAAGLRRGAEQAGVEIPGGELAVLPELIRGHPSPRGFDLLGFCVGLVELDRLVTGERVEPSDAIVGLPSSGVHSNGLTLARRALPDLLEAPAELGGPSVGEALLEPTVIYVGAVRELVDSGLEVHGLAHITGDGLLNLLRLRSDVGYRIDAPLPRPAIFDLIATRGDVGEAELHEVFNLGCGFCCVVPAAEVDEAVGLLGAHHPGTAAIGEVTARAGVVEVPAAGLAGTRELGFSPTQ